MMVWLKVTGMRMTSLLLDAEKGLSVHERGEGRGVGSGGAAGWAPAVPSDLHRITVLGVALGRSGVHIG
jgi:hypothetical protein